MGGGGGGSWHYGRITWILSGHKQTPSTPRRSILIGLLTGIVPRFPWCNKLDLFEWPQSQFQRCKSLELNEHGPIYFLQELSEGVVEISYPWWIMLVVNMKAIIYSQSRTGINFFFRPHFHCCLSSVHSLRISLSYLRLLISAVQIYDFHIFTVV